MITALRVIVEPPEKKMGGASSHAVRQKRLEVRSMEKREVQMNRRSYTAMLKSVRACAFSNESFYKDEAWELQINYCL